MSYRDFATQEEIDRAYDTMQGRDPGQLAKAWLERSDVSRSRHRVTLDRAYGPSLAERMDIFHAEGPAAPVHIFYHGGFWRALSHREFSFVVDSLVAAGITVAVVNYALCPQVRFSELVRQNQAALAHIHRHADELQVDPNQLSISGHSAGGHICAMMVTTDWEGMFGLPADVIRGVLCISGLFDLRPFPWSGLQPKLQLTGRDVEEFSPLWRSPCVQAPMHLVVGGQETEEFQRQTTAYARHLEQKGLSVELHLLEEDDHFSVLEHYLDGRFVDWIKAFHAL